MWRKVMNPLKLSAFSCAAVHINVVIIHGVKLHLLDLYKKQNKSLHANTLETKTKTKQKNPALQFHF